jgi:muramoyltetrapeptide carboxypeptidase
MLECRVPEPLRPGDRLIALAPSGALRERSAFEQGLSLWQDQGYVVDLAAGYDRVHGYLAGTDAQRRQQLAQAWRNPAYKGILCVRGGWGAARLLEAWTWPVGEPKWLIGFSDITTLLWSLSIQGISGVHGPLLTTLAQEPDESRQRLFNWVSGQGKLEPLQGKGWGQGMARGYFLPGNLTVATHLLNTIVQPPMEGVILALEDTSEAPYRIDRLLTQWRMMGLFEKVAGIALGRFSNCNAPPKIPSFTVEEVLYDRLGDLKIPIVSDLAFGHDGVNLALPVGCRVQLDGDAGLLEFEERFT